MRKLILSFACMVALFIFQPLSAQVIKEEPFAYSEALLEAAKSGDPDAMYKIGLCYFVGKEGNPQIITSTVPLERDYKKAFDYLSKAAKKGSALAMLNLGNLYTNGLGTPKGKDLKLALEWLEKAAEAGCPDALVNIGRLYETNMTGLLTERIVKIKAKDANQTYAFFCNKALEYYHKAAELGSATGAYNIAVIHKTGLLLQPIDYQASVKWLRKAANLGHQQAVNDLAVSYINGVGIDRDIRTGLNLLKMAAAANQNMALHNLGVYAYNGLYLPMDKETATLYFLRAYLLGYNNITALNECFGAGLHNAKNFTTVADWINHLKKNFDLNTPLPELIIPQRQTVYQVPIGSVVNDCGSWTILNEDSISITENQYDGIVKDPQTGKLTATRFGLTTTLAEDGTEEYPLFEQLLNKLKAVSDNNTISAYSMLILQTDNFNILDYRSAAYFNMAVFYFNQFQQSNAIDYTLVTNYLNKVLAEDPDFAEATELLTYIQQEEEAIRKQKRKERRAIMWDCIFSISGSVLDLAADIAGDIAEKQQEKREREAARKAEIKAKNDATRARLSARQKATKQKFRDGINRRFTSRAYSGYVDQINNMQLYPEKYDQQQKDYIQGQMKKIRVKDDLPYHESEDW